MLGMRHPFTRALYEQDGRHEPEHEAHQTYTGLWIAYGNAPCTDEAPRP